MHGVGIEKGIKQAGTANIANDHNLMAGQTHALKCLIQAAGDALMGAARA
jgi:hypothetical protein